MAGRKPKPTSLKQISGNPGKRKLNGSEPKFSALRSKCPKHLDAVARKEWKRVTEELLALRIMSEADVAALAAYCSAYSRWVKAELEIRKDGEVIKLPTGEGVRNPWLIVSEKALDSLRKFATEFGLTPSSRTRLHVAEDSSSDPDAAFEAYMKSIGAADSEPTQMNDATQLQPDLPPVRG